MLRIRRVMLAALSCGALFASLSGCTASLSMEASTKTAKPEPVKPVAKKEAKDEKAKDEQEKTTAKPAKAEPEPEEAPSAALPGNLVFDKGQTALKQDAATDAVLNQLKQFMDQQTRVTLLRIEGHSDNTKKPEENMKDSGERALAVKTWLTAHGVATSRLVAVGFGETKPIADNGTEAGRAQNRRVEYKVVALNGKPYLGADPLGGGTEFQ